MKSWTETCNMMLREMFKRVGLKFPNKQFTDQKDWFTKKTWTMAERNAFERWAKKLIMKRHRCYAKIAQLEVGNFVLMWGWSVSDWGQQGKDAEHGKA